MKLTYKILFLMLSVSFLSGCGFTLRGSANLPPQLQTILLVSTNTNSDITQELRRSLLANDVTLLETAEAGSYRLEIGEEDIIERIISVNSDARAGEYELSLSVPFQLNTTDSILIESEILTIEKVYLADPNSAVAKAEERELIENEMRRELISLILRRLQNVTL